MWRIECGRIQERLPTLYSGSVARVNPTMTPRYVVAGHGLAPEIGDIIAYRRIRLHPANFDLRGRDISTIDFILNPPKVHQYVAARRQPI